MKLLLGINLILAILVVTFLILREDGRPPDQTEISRVVAEPEGEGPEGKALAEGQGTNPTAAERSAVPTQTPSGKTDGETRQEVALEKHPELIIEGVVIDPEGKLVRGYWVRAHEGGETGKMVAMSHTDEKGHFLFRVPKQGKYLLTGQDMSRWLRTSVLACPPVRIDSGDRDVRIQLVLGESGEIHAVLTGFGKLTIPNRVQVIIKNEDSATGGYHRIVDCPGGMMKIPGLAPGRYKLEFFVPDLLAEVPAIQVRANQITDLGRIYFNPQGSIAGVILDAKGRPLPGVGVYAKRPYTGWLRPDSKGLPKAPKASTTTDSKGRFATRGYRDPWTPITFVVKAYAPLDIILTSSDQARTLRLVLQRAATLDLGNYPRFMKVEGKRTPLTAYKLKATRLPESYSIWKDNPLLGQGIQRSLPKKKDSPTIHDLPPGEYVIQLRTDWGKGTIELSFRLVAGKTHKLTWK